MALAIPEFETAPSAGVIIRARNASDYDSASTGRRVSRWNAPTTSPNNNLSSLSLMRDRARASQRNDGYAKGATDELVSSLIGTGIKPLSKADDVALRPVLHDLFLRWTGECNADGKQTGDYYAIQSQVARTWLVAGEVFVRLRNRLASDGLSVPLQLQVLEPEMCPHTYTATLASGNRVRAGIEFNAIGDRVAYWFHPVRPGSPDDYNMASLVRVPADAVIHLYDPLRPGQLRGEPNLQTALLVLHELQKINDATVLHQQVGNMFAGFIKRDATTSEQAVNPFDGSAIDPDDDAPLVSLEPGLMQELGPGESVEFSKPPDVSQTYEAFTRLQLSAAAAGTGVPYEVFSGDMSKVNDRSLRVILQRFRRRIQAWQHQILGHQLCERVWNAWLYRAYLSGAVALPAEFLTNRWAYARVRWMPQAFPYINPVQDVQAIKAEIRAGLTSRQAAIAERGEDAEVIDAEQAADNARAKAFDLVYDSNAKHTSDAGVTQARPDGSVLPED